mmetsp:Transcript_16329/g.28862  ORF Transcript_16329/g.28862 Transcript_16329/m.28862 type:complete len:206 (+) Transcript_16329:391-1008(+)
MRPQVARKRRAPCAYNSHSGRRVSLYRRTSAGSSAARRARARPVLTEAVFSSRALPRARTRSHTSALALLGRCAARCCWIIMSTNISTKTGKFSVRPTIAKPSRFLLASFTFALMYAWCLGSSGRRFLFARDPVSLAIISPTLCECKPFFNGLPNDWRKTSTAWASFLYFFLFEYSAADAARKRGFRTVVMKMGCFFRSISFCIP